MWGIVLAGLTAGGLAFAELASKFGKLHLVFREGVWRFWLGRLALEAGLAIVIVIVARATAVPHANAAWAGPIIGGISAAGLRSSFVDVGEDGQPYGLRTITDPARAWFNERLKNRASATGATWHAGLLNVIVGSRLEIREICDHLHETLRRADASALVKATPQIQSAASDTASPRRELVQMLLEIGMQAVGDDYADALRKLAEKSSDA